jgi:hypothetical protein
VKQGELLKAIADYCGTSVQMIEENYCGTLTLRDCALFAQSSSKSPENFGVPDGIWTRVIGVKGECTAFSNPLKNGSFFGGSRFFYYFSQVSAKTNGTFWTFGTPKIVPELLPKRQKSARRSIMELTSYLPESPERLATLESWLTFAILLFGILTTVCTYVAVKVRGYRATVEKSALEKHSKATDTKLSQTGEALEALRKQSSESESKMTQELLGGKEKVRRFGRRNMRPVTLRRNSAI